MEPRPRLPPNLRTLDSRGLALPLWPPPGPGHTVPHWKMERDQAQAGEWRVGLGNTELLRGRVRIWPKEVLRRSWQLAARLRWNLKASRSGSVLRKAHSGEETPMGCHPPSLPFRFGPRPISSVLTAWQGSCLHPKGSCYLSPGQGCGQDPDNPGKNEQMAFLSQPIGGQLPPSPHSCQRLSQAALQDPAEVSG